MFKGKSEMTQQNRSDQNKSDQNKTADTQTETPAPVSKKRRLPQWLLWALAPAVVLAGVAWFTFNSGRYQSTDNAYLHADIITIAPEIAGRVVEVAVQANQRVKAGDVLFRLEADKLQLAVDEINAQGVAIGEYLDSSREGYHAAVADLAARQADVKHNQQQFNRVQDLRAKGMVSQENLDDAENVVATAIADRDAAVAMVAKSKSMLGGDAKTPLADLAGYKIVQAQLKKAQIDLDHAVIRAPVDGYIGSETLQVGDYLMIGQATMPLVTDTLWVDANFKETDMTWVVPGQKATVEVDTYPGEEWRAEVASISPASASMFSVLPAQNATGNWVKVVQRIPVRLRILSPDDGHGVLRAGMSVEVRIDTGEGHTLADRWLGTTDSKKQQQPVHAGVVTK